MCRFLVYKGTDEILLSKLVLDPAHSILKQSFDSRLRLDTRRGQNNADGFGIGFYTDPKHGLAPCLFTSTTPAWNCQNLHRLASKTASRLIFAHVRATTEGTLSEDNCHPFCHGTLMWMHNGGIGGWKQIKRRLGERLADKWYLNVVGGTDSEWAFALFLDTLERMGHDPSSQPANGFGPTVLRKAMLRTIAIINELIDNIPESVIHAENVDTRSLLNFAVTDGHSVICTRYVSSSTDEAASLYYSSGTLWETRSPTPGQQADYQMSRSDKGADVVLVASEPLTFERENWVNVPTNSILTIHNQTVMVHPIVDQYYARSPHHRRSTAYVHTKGFSANEKDLSRSPTPLTVPPSLPSLSALPQLHDHRQQSFLRPTIPTFGSSVSRSRTPDASRSRSPLSVTQSEPVESSTAAAASQLQPPSISDIREITPPPGQAARSGQQQSQPVQGNIKKKRASLSAIEGTTFGGAGPLGGLLIDMPEPVREYTNGNPNKIAQLFPELALR
ncbi:amidophosphoribosyltransferase-like protein [Thermochaetoides thermophila DSM 1495]|uniref:Amidophosphoribosyltransferase-like protein n=1 Tax=Chaetomium thermophilum (strain DSM 1495 / CBS 144.50 / IMI 039719) TaxID=759272 RepID=G0SGC6_CHATD|nr:amidophosphoribosyltransferase-like protein [Thermochaetoides thermophila DSM 1495]EGS17265.1 amidophosphoribosyltransferase-like protein [Thermochaetoides thermophila DSM 1495]